MTAEHPFTRWAADLAAYQAERAQQAAQGAATAPQEGKGRAMTTGMMSSKSNEWETPQALFDALDREFGPFTLDPCATPENAKCARYFTKEQDGLTQPWDGIVWLNPLCPSPCRMWVRKAVQEAQKGIRVVCLLAARTDTRLWHKVIVPNAEEIRFLPGRIRFSGKGRAPFPSAVVVFGKPKPSPTPAAPAEAAAAQGEKRQDAAHHVADAHNMMPTFSEDCALAHHERCATEGCVCSCHRRPG